MGTYVPAPGLALGPKTSVLQSQRTEEVTLWDHGCGSVYQALGRVAGPFLVLITLWPN